MAPSNDDWQENAIKKIFKWLSIGKEVYNILKDQEFSTLNELELLSNKNINTMQINMLLDLKQATMLTILVLFIVGKMEDFSVTTRSGLTNQYKSQSHNQPCLVSIVEEELECCKCY